LGAKSFGETFCVDENTDQAQVFGKNGREVLPIKIRLNARHFVNAYGRRRARTRLPSMSA
jgi:hypothetical protein